MDRKDVKSEFWSSLFALLTMIVVFLGGIWYGKTDFQEELAKQGKAHYTVNEKGKPEFTLGITDCTTVEFR